MNIRKENTLIKLRGNAGARTNGSELAMRKCGLKIRRKFLITRAVMLWSSFLVRWNCFEDGTVKLMKENLCCGAWNPRGWICGPSKSSPVYLLVCLLVSMIESSQLVGLSVTNWLSGVSRTNLLAYKEQTSYLFCCLSTRNRLRFAPGTTSYPHKP